MHETPFFPDWSARLNPMGSRTTKTLRTVAAFTLCQLESAFAPWIPESLFPKTKAGDNSRDGCAYTRRRTFWCMLWQALNPGASTREVVRQLQALFKLEGGPEISSCDGGYCTAKARLDRNEFPLALRATARAADQLVSTPARFKGRPLKVTDGCVLTVQDTPKNRTAYPPVKTSATPTFPLVRLVVLFSLLSGAILAVATGSCLSSELALLHALARQLERGDILLGDRGFGNFPVIAWLQSLGVDFVGRTTRRVDGRRRLKQLGRNDWLVRWRKTDGCPSRWLTPQERTALPGELTLRVVRGSCFHKGFRVRQMTVVTTLLDPELYPAQDILQAYLRRWRLEMCLDDLKTTLGMDFLRNRSPHTVEREIHARLIAHNLLRCTMAQAAKDHGVLLESFSFKGSLDAVRQFTSAMAQARSKAKRRELWESMLRTLAQDLVPDRPGRREPRAVKRKKNKYPRLRGPRRSYAEPPKRNVRRSQALRRKLALV